MGVLLRLYTGREDRFRHLLYAIFHTSFPHAAIPGLQLRGREKNLDINDLALSGCPEARS